jgi:hypothetical protein
MVSWPCKSIAYQHSSMLPGHMIAEYQHSSMLPEHTAVEYQHKDPHSRYNHMAVRYRWHSGSGSQDQTCRSWQRNTNDKCRAMSYIMAGSTIIKLFCPIKEEENEHRSVSYFENCITRCTVPHSQLPLTYTILNQGLH